MNQYIQIRYKPDWHSNPNHWQIWFCLNYKQHREKSPSHLNSRGNWDWYIQSKYQKLGDDFDWNKE